MVEVDSDPYSRNIETALMGGYPLTYVTVTTPAGGTITTVTTCPTGIWRVITHAEGIPNAAGVNGIVPVLYIRSLGADYHIATGLQRPAALNGTNQFASLRFPVVLTSGQSLMVADLNANAGQTVIASAGYIDVPIHTGSRAQKATRRG